eukprot:1432964-Alexandrium_andersonii.AAC.1
MAAAAVASAQRSGQAARGSRAGGQCEAAAPRPRVSSRRQPAARRCEERAEARVAAGKQAREPSRPRPGAATVQQP